MSITRLGWVLALCATVSCGLAWLPRAHAQNSADETAARQSFEAARNAYAQGDYEAALRDFQRSYDLSHRTMLLYNIGMALDRLRRDEEAIAAYEKYLAANTTADNRQVVEQRLAVLRAAVAKQQAHVQTAPTPEETARAQIQSQPVAAASSEPSDRETPQPIYKKWWLWTSIGAVVVAGAVVGIVVSQSGDKKSEGALVPDGMTRVVRL